jgi:hypothetical protein
VTGVHPECITGSGVILRVDSDRCAHRVYYWERGDIKGR